MEYSIRLKLRQWYLVKVTIQEPWLWQTFLYTIRTLRFNSQEAAEQTGIPVSNICLAATHTHADLTCYGEMKDYISKMGSSQIPNEGKYAFMLHS